MSVQLELIDALGRVTTVQSDRLMVAGQHRITLPVQELASGAYILRLLTEQGTKSTRFVVE